MERFRDRIVPHMREEREFEFPIELNKIKPVRCLAPIQTKVSLLYVRGVQFHNMSPQHVDIHI